MTGRFEGIWAELNSPVLTQLGHAAPEDAGFRSNATVLTGLDRHQPIAITVIARAANGPSVPVGELRLPPYQRQGLDSGPRGARALSVDPTVGVAP
jgi:hypothetical protein